MMYLFSGFSGVTPFIDINNPPAMGYLEQQIGEGFQLEALMRSELIAQQEAIQASLRCALASIVPLNPPDEIVALYEDTHQACGQIADLMRNQPQEDTLQTMKSKQRMNEQLQARIQANMGRINDWLAKLHEAM